MKNIDYCIDSFGPLSTEGQLLLLNMDKTINCTYTDLLISSILWMSEPRCTEDGNSGETNWRSERF